MEEDWDCTVIIIPDSEELASVSSVECRVSHCEAPENNKKVSDEKGGGRTGGGMHRVRRRIAIPIADALSSRPSWQAGRRRL